MALATKDFHRLLKRVGKLTDGQATIQDIDWDEGTLQEFYVILQPNGGMYKNGKFKFSIRLSDDYPDSPPAIWCHTDIYHPNIDPTECCYPYDMTTNVCLNALENGVWNRSFGLEGAILGLLFLMHNPNLQDPLSPYFGGAGNEDSFKENVQKYMAGEEFDDLSFEIDFCVKDGVLITEQKTATSESNKDESQNLTDGQIEDLKIVNDVISVTETKIGNTDGSPEYESKHDDLNGTVNGATNKLQEVTTMCSLNEQDVIKEEDSDVFNKNTCSKPISDLEINTDELDCSANDGTCNDEESLECGIELVNIDGECVLLIHSTEMDDEVCKQETDNTTETNTNDSTSVDTNVTGEDNFSTQERTEIKNETDNLCKEENNAKEDSNLDSGVLAETNTSCNRENTAKVDSKLDATDVKTESDDLCNAAPAPKEDFEESEINVMSPVSESDIQFNDKHCKSDDDSLSNGAKCGCGTWYTIRSTFSKIVHTIGHNKLYRDIGI